MLVQFNLAETKTVKINNKLITLKKDTDYIIQDVWAKDLKLNYFPIENKEYNNININADNKKILFIRALGFGDILFLSPVINYIREIYPSCQIGFGSFPFAHSLIMLLDKISYIETLPIEKKEFEKYDYIFTIQNLIEQDKTGTNVYKLIFNKLGIDINYISDEYKRPMIKNYLKRINEELVNEKLILFHPFSGNNVRSLNIHLSNEICKQLIDNGFEVILISNLEEKNKYYNTFTSKIKWLVDIVSDSFFETAKLLRQAKMLIGVDSSMVHLAQAVGTPTIALYGPFPAKSRLEFYKDITIVDTNPNCRCLQHNKTSCHKSYVSSQCLNIDPELIINLVKNEEYKLNYEVKDPDVKKY